MEHFPMMKYCADSSLSMPHPCRILQKYTSFGESYTHPLTYVKSMSNIGIYNTFSTASLLEIRQDLLISYNQHSNRNTPHNTRRERKGKKISKIAF
uniref:Putative ovule protein n=1 Tax=Solanum chacoense TaxID=4108 RepID=A0A0V0GV37_SOLCH